MAETDNHSRCVRCWDCELLVNHCTVCKDMMEQERVSALVACSRRISRQQRQRRQQSESFGSVSSVADSIGSLRGSTPIPSTTGGMGKGGGWRD